MDFGAFPGDSNVRRASFSDHPRFRDLGSADFPPGPVSGGFCLPHVRTPPIMNPFMNDQCHLHHLKLYTSGRNQMVGGDLGLCEDLSGMSLSNECNRVLARPDPFWLDPDVLGSRVHDGFSVFDRGIRRDDEIPRRYNAFHNVSSGRETSLYTSNGVSLGGYAADSDDDMFRLLHSRDFNPEGFNEIIARIRRDILMEQRNGSFRQSLPNMDTGSCFRVPQLHSQVMNDVYNSPPMFGGNKVFQSLSSSAMEDCSRELKASSLEDGLIIQGPNNSFPANEMESYFKDDLWRSGDESENQGFLPSLASMIGFYGSVYVMAKDQIGCRFLQRMFDEGTFLDVTMIFGEVIDHLIELTIDPFGNYFIQKLLGVCTEEQRSQIVIMMMSKPGQLIKVSLNTYGTRVVQKLIETLRTKKQIALVTSALKPGFLSLVRDLNGNHVIQRCLQSLGPDDNKFIFEAATRFCIEIATHRHGCCVLQRCVAFSAGPQRSKLIAEISRNSLVLSQDPFGNYVVQYIIEQKVPAGNVLCQLREHYVQLSKQKFSSHVVEKCLRHFPESRSQIVHELISVTNFEQLLQDPYANYVIQSALAVTKGAVKASLVEKVQPYKNLRTSPYCKRIFSRSLPKK
ncbi:PREDICTED: pumilio homolog 11-like [Tarenaya hassleriana]|uniref:pumilio homolog 11-like n=1 Tax=Tarenaya hassleriana TaxID=28532 RepID=UPI00053C71FE|nr:PREDICTED: pumilio homolog 11-like [Tarenaya hassleriana]